MYVDAGIPQMFTARAFVVLGALLALTQAAQQVADREYSFNVREPAFATGKGPLILVDEAHHNGLLLEDRLTAFGKLARADGFVVRAQREPVTARALADARLLVIINAGGRSGLAYGTSVFAPEEIGAIRKWVVEGGALLLVADHMPLPGYAAALAKAFGVAFRDGFTREPELFALKDDALFAAVYDRPTSLRRGDGTIRPHRITDGRRPAEGVNEIATFTGQAFDGEGLEPLLAIPEGFVSVFPVEPWEFTPRDPRIDAKGMLQGAVKAVGKGRAAFFGEAAMFSAQWWGPKKVPMGMNHPLAKDNPQLVLNVLRWLAGVID